MKAEGVKLPALMQANVQYIIPLFQRFYSWGSNDWEQLWKELTDLREDASTDWHHFMGTLVFVSQKHYPGVLTAIQVIDGQQRLVTLSLVLCALRNIAHDCDSEELATEIDQHFLVHRFRKGREKYRIYPRQRDRDDYMMAIDGTAKPGGGIGDALHYFRDQIMTVPDSETENGLRAFFNLLQTRLDFVYIGLDDENPYRTFRSLDSTGVDLSEADLIRNFVFMHVDIDDQEHLDEEQWTPLENHFLSDKAGKEKLDTRTLSAFFRDYLAREGAYVRPETSFVTFEKRFSGVSFDPRATTVELRHYADLYDVIRGRTSFGVSSVDTSLEKLRALDSSTTYPLLLNLFHRIQADGLQPKSLARCIELLAGFIMRRYVCGWTSRQYGQWFVAGCRELGDDPVHGLGIFLGSKGYPTDAQFVEELVRVNLYTGRYTKPMLIAIEQSYGNKETILNLPDFTIEHIMPQTLTPEWRSMLGPDEEQTHPRLLHTLGNLTLTVDNSVLSNHPLKRKTDIYEKSKTAMNAEIAKVENWSAAESEDRAHKLAQRAVGIWTGPSPGTLSVGSSEATGVGSLTPTQRMRLEYWSAFVKHLQACDSLLPLAQVGPEQTLYFPLHHPDVGLFSWQVTGRWKMLTVGVEIIGHNRLKKFAALRERRGEIEGEIGISLNWSRRPSGNESVIDLEMAKVDPANRADWPLQFEWLREQLELVYLTFTDGGAAERALQASVSGQAEGHSDETDFSMEENNHLDGASEAVRILYTGLKHVVESWPDVATGVTGSYIYFRAARNFAEIHPRDKNLIIVLRPEGFSIPERETQQVDGVSVERVPDAHRWTLNHKVVVDTGTNLATIEQFLRQSYDAVHSGKS